MELTKRTKERIVVSFSFFLSKTDHALFSRDEHMSGEGKEALFLPSLLIERSALLSALNARIEPLFVSC